MPSVSDMQNPKSNNYCDYIGQSSVSIDCLALWMLGFSDWNSIPIYSYYNIIRD